jgi:phospholipid/cholesterol/gamma-HCH transport system ATP-binding protein
MTTEAIITVKELTIGWSREATLLEAVSFEVQRGEVFAILGGSGCGKSTLLRYLIGLEEPLSGTIEVAGATRGRPSFGVMFQAGALFGSMTVEENVGLPLREWSDLPADAIAALARAKLRLVGLEQAANKLPSELSGGMKKRAAIARALALEPDLLFLDEPGAGLDPILSAELDELVLTLKRAAGVTVVMVTHELASIEAIVDRAILLDKEEKGIIAEGAPADLRESNDERVRRFFHRHPRAA